MSGVLGGNDLQALAEKQAAEAGVRQKAVQSQFRRVETKRCAGADLCVCELWEL